MWDSWLHPQICTGHLATEIKRLKRGSGKPLLAHGGAGFARFLIGTGLIDEYMLLVHPVVLGKGMPIFSDLAGPLDLGLIESIPFKSGEVCKFIVRKRNLANKRSGDSPRLRSLALAQSPLAFKRRNIFTTSVDLPLALRTGRPFKSAEEKRRTNAERQRRFRKSRLDELAKLRKLARKHARISKRALR